MSSVVRRIFTTFRTNATDCLSVCNVDARLTEIHSTAVDATLVHDLIRPWTVVVLTFNYNYPHFDCCCQQSISLSIQSVLVLFQYKLVMSAKAARAAYLDHPVS